MSESSVVPGRPRRRAMRSAGPPPEETQANGGVEAAADRLGTADAGTLGIDRAESGAPVDSSESVDGGSTDVARDAGGSVATETRDATVATGIADTTVATKPADTVVAAEAASTAVATAPAETVVAAKPADTAVAAKPADTVVAAKSAETVVAAETADTIVAAKTADTTVAAGTADTTVVKETDDATVVLGKADAAIDLGKSGTGDDGAAAVDPAPEEAHIAAKSGSRKWLAVGAAAAAALLVVALLVTSGFFIVSLRSADARDARRADYVQTAKQAILNLTTIKDDTAKADIDRVLAVASGELKAEYSQRRDAYANVVEQAKVRATGEIIESALESDDENSARVLVAAKQTLTNAGMADPQTRFYRFRVTLTRGDSGITASQVEFVA